MVQIPWMNKLHMEKLEKYTAVFSVNHGDFSPMASKLFFFNSKVFLFEQNLLEKKLWYTKQTKVVCH